MAIDIIETLMEFLCQQNTLSNCQQFVQGYATSMEQLFYFFFFPLVFMLLFIYILSEAVTEKAKKFRVLLGVAIFIFIILQGWYHFFLWISKFWFYSIIILGGLYVFMHKMGIRKGDGSSLPGQTRTASSWGRPSYLVKKMIKGKTGQEKKIEAGIRELEGIVNDIEHPRKFTDMGSLRGKYNSTKAGVVTDIKTLEAQVGFGAEELIVKKFWDRISKLDKRVAKAGEK